MDPAQPIWIQRPLWFMPEGLCFFLFETRSSLVGDSLGIGNPLKDDLQSEVKTFFGIVTVLLAESPFPYPTITFSTHRRLHNMLRS